MLIIPKSITKGIKGVTNKFVIGDIIDSCPKLVIVIGIVNTKALKVKTSASLTEKVFGT